MGDYWPAKVFAAITAALVLVGLAGHVWVFAIAAAVISLALVVAEVKF